MSRMVAIGRTALRRQVVVVASAVCMLLLGGCSDASGRNAWKYDPEREQRVAADRDAAADQIIEAGGPVHVATSDDRTLVAWQVTSDDDEGPQQAAWRLYGEDGERLADGTLGQVSEQGAVPELTEVPDGFLLENYTGRRLRHIDPAGTVTDVSISRERVPARPGDVLLESLERTGSDIYRPTEHQGYRLPRLPFGRPQGVALDQRGTLWVLLSWNERTAPVASSPGGAGPWQRTAIELGRGIGYPQGLSLAGTRVVVPTVRGNLKAVLTGVWTHSTDGDPASPWARLPAEGVDLGDMIFPEVYALPSGRLLIPNAHDELFAQDADLSWSRLRLPKDAKYARPAVTGDALFLVSGQNHQLYRSDDDGTTWDVVDR